MLLVCRVDCLTVCYSSASSPLSVSWPITVLHHISCAFYLTTLQYAVKLCSDSKTCFSVWVSTHPITAYKVFTSVTSQVFLSHESFIWPVRSQSVQLQLAISFCQFCTGNFSRLRSLESAEQRFSPMFVCWFVFKVVYLFFYVNLIISSWIPWKYYCILLGNILQ